MAGLMKNNPTPMKTRIIKILMMTATLLIRIEDCIPRDKIRVTIKTMATATMLM